MHKSVLVFSLLMYSITVDILGSTFTWCPSLAQITVIEKTQSVLNKMERVDGSFVEGKLNRFLPAYHLCSTPGYDFAEAPIKILMFN